MDKATVAMSNADAAARGALTRQTQATTDASDAQQGVVNALERAQNQKAHLESTLSADRSQLENAQIELTGITNLRAAYVAWQRQQAAIAAQETARKRQQQLLQQRAAAAAAARLARPQSSGSSSQDSGSAQSGAQASGNTPAPAGGSWTVARGQQAVDRAMRYLGMRYSWAAGDASGPTYGVSEAGNAWNDSSVLGFDCSG
jgi:cell wall-associated NlpC family hydrolase